MEPAYTIQQWFLGRTPGQMVGCIFKCRLPKLLPTLCPHCGIRMNTLYAFACGHYICASCIIVRMHTANDYGLTCTLCSHTVPKTLNTFDKGMYQTIIDTLYYN